MVEGETLENVSKGVLRDAMKSGDKQAQTKADVAVGAAGDLVQSGVLEKDQATQALKDVTSTTKSGGS